MTTRQFVLFLSGLVLPSLYQRTKLALNRLSFHNTRLRDKSGLNLHHGHWGFFYAMIATWMLAFGSRNIVSIGLAGYGWGLMLDEIIPLLRMPSVGRSQELDVYDRSRSGTILLVSVSVVFSILIFFVFR